MQEPQEMWVQSLGWEDPLEEEMQPTAVFLPGKFNGQRSLVGYRPWGHNESNMTEHAQTHYSRQKWNEIVPLAEMWMDLEIFIQSEVSQKEKTKYCIILLYVESRKMV